MSSETMELVVAVIAGGVGVEIAKAVFGRNSRKIGDVSAWYSLWEKETDRLHRDVETLRILVSILEEEIVSLGGDPNRLRMELRRRLAELDQEERQ